MPRKLYDSRPRAARAYEEEFWDAGGHPEPTVETREAGWEPTGLLDQYGSPIMAYSGPDPIGFLWHDENGSLKPRHLFDEDNQQEEGRDLASSPDPEDPEEDREDDLEMWRR